MNKMNTKEYWNDRASSGQSPRDLVYASVDFERFDTETRKILSLFADKKVLDVGCGYGRLSDIFTNYLGIDFSEEMIKLAREQYPNKRFEVAETTDEQFDVVFECMCLTSLRMTAKAFAKKYPAPVVMCLEPKQFTIFYK